MFFIADQKAKLKRHIPVFIIKITLIAGKINSLKFLQMMLSLLDQLTVDEVSALFLYIYLIKNNTYIVLHSHTVYLASIFLWCSRVSFKLQDPMFKS